MKESSIVAFDCSGKEKKWTFPCYFLFSIMKLELDYSGGIFLWYRAGILRCGIQEGNLYIYKRLCFYVLLYWRRGNSEWFNHIPSPSKTHIQDTSDWQGSSHSNRNLGLGFILLEFMSSTVVSWVNGRRNIKWHWITDCIMVLFWGSGGDSLLLWGWSEVGNA